MNRKTQVQNIAISWTFPARCGAVGDASRGNPRLLPQPLPPPTPTHTPAP